MVLNLLLLLSTLLYCYCEDFGIAGTGLMGTAIGECLLKNDYSVAAWNRSPEKTKTLTEAGATSVKEFKELFKKTNTVIMTVVGDPDMAIATILLESVGKDLKGKTVIQWTSHDPLSAEAQSKMVEKYGGTWIGGAMIQTYTQVCSPAGFYFMSGANEDKFKELEPALEKLGPQKYMGTNAGFGALYDIAILVHYFIGYEGHLLALALLEAAGGDADVFEELTLQIYNVMLEPITKMTTNNFKTADFRTAMLMSIESSIPTYEMHSRYMRKIGLDCSVWEAALKVYKEMVAANPAVGKYDVSAKAKYFNNKNLNFLSKEKEEL
mmetsp:Transcript_74031/g.205721  ORF Transcript_74031/g.205721 Transcript_74031/m.205721 type:complete len:323 (+) Transcript_74031:34-1002(+)